ncbi:uncharacterized protein LOC141664575 [Apium graveolens]|uniref:uncharacterized protein LOC141664575 n=1 Tax=Apium graveolens TaxID=4045 RepID=UPI003D78E9AD
MGALPLYGLTPGGKASVWPPLCPTLGIIILTLFFSVGLIDNFPEVHLDREDKILWAGVDVTKVTNWDIWNSLRNKEHEVSWAPAVWSKLVIYRYAHHQWVACHGRLPTLARLARFGITSTQLCYLCIGGTETDNHILRHCPYSAWVLGMIYHVLKVHIFCDSWLHCLELALQISDRPLRALSLYCLQIVCYHIWRERKSRAHDKECFGPQQLFDGIMVDFKAILSGSLKFTKIVCSRSDLIF